MEFNSSEHMSAADPSVCGALDAQAAAWLKPADWIEVARLMILARALDDLEEAELIPAGRIVYGAASRGHELAQILLGLALDHPRDAATL